MLIRIREAGLSFLAVRSDAFLRFRAGEAEHFERERGVERRAGHPQPVVERVLGPAQRRLRAGSELARHLERLRLQLGFLAGERNEPQPLRLLAADLLAQQQVVLRLRQAAKQRQDDGRVVASRHAQARVAVDEPRVLRRDRDVREQARYQPRADRRAVHRRDHHLRAVDQVVDQVARLAPDARPHGEVARHLLHHREIAAGREPLPCAAQDRDARVAVEVDVQPDARQLRVHARGGDRQLAALLAHDDFEHAGLEAADFQCLVRGVVHAVILQFAHVLGFLRRRRRRARAHPRAGEAHPGAQLEHRRRADRRQGVLQVRELPAHGRLQVSRRLQRHGAACARGKAPRRDRFLLRQPRPGRRAGGKNIGRKNADRHAWERPAGEARRHARLWRRSRALPERRKARGGDLEAGEGKKPQPHSPVRPSAGHRRPGHGGEGADRGCRDARLSAGALRRGRAAVGLRDRRAAHAARLQGGRRGACGGRRRYSSRQDENSEGHPGPVHHRRRRAHYLARQSYFPASARVRRRHAHRHRRRAAARDVLPVGADEDHRRADRRARRVRPSREEARGARAGGAARRRDPFRGKRRPALGGSKVAGAPMTMRAIEISQPGGPEVLKLVERPVPQPKAHEILVKVAAAGVNRPDVLQRSGNYPVPPDASDLPGLEVAGEVAAKGSAATLWKIGDQLCALVHGGGYAEYCTVPEVQALPVPKGLSLIEAASLPETCFTVWGNVYDRAKLAPGESLLVQGGTSGIGVTAIQMAAATGNRVFATAGSDEKCAACVRLGAEKAFNYRAQDFAAEVLAATAGKGVNVILDMVGGDYVPRELKCLAEEGRLVFIAYLRGPKTELNIDAVMRKRLTITGSTLPPRSGEFKGYIARNLREKIWPRIEAGKIKPVIYKTFPLAHAAEAHQLMESSQHIGKLVLTV